MKQMNERYTDILNGKSDEELLSICSNLADEAIAQNIYTEAGVDDLTQQCRGFVQKMSKIPFLGKAAVNINLFCGMLKDSVKKDYHISLKTKGIILGALTYLVMPVDIIPDAIPIIGMLDDAQVLMLVAESLCHQELANYKNYLLENNNNAFVDALNSATRHFYGNNEECNNSDNYVEEET